MTRYLMIFWYIVHCIKLRVNPWNFFQLNADYFNRKKGIYSKHDINRLIPAKWRLGQYIDNKSYFPAEFPVFLKPEWGQNSYGIHRADSLLDLKRIRKTTLTSNLTYLVQEAAQEQRELEVFYVRDADKPFNYAVLSITEVKNQKVAKFPINGVHNPYCYYRDRTPELSEEQLDKVWRHISKIGQFRMARVGLKTNSDEDLIRGRFHIVEINLFTPMPLNLLDIHVGWNEKIQFIKQAMYHIAKNTTKVLTNRNQESIFFKKVVMHYKVKS